MRAALKAAYGLDKNTKMLGHLLLRQFCIGSGRCQRAPQMLRGLLLVHGSQKSPFHVVIQHGMVSSMC
ncbi:hypothetical protein B0G73_11278 [Paraburkholderia sp. BL25I1N1]|nr:hypothetical protein B0G73_11278 [Paraburkholderia sp. BL25I1N1]